MFIILVNTYSTDDYIEATVLLQGFTTDFSIRE